MIKKRRGFHRNCGRIDISSFEILHAKGLSARLALPENWLMRFFRCRRLTCEWQTAARGSVVRVGRRVLLGKSDRDDFRNFAAVAKRGLRYLAEPELFGSFPKTWEYEGSYKIISTSTTLYLQRIRRCWEFFVNIYSYTRVLVHPAYPCDIYYILGCTISDLYFCAREKSLTHLFLYFTYVCISLFSICYITINL